MTRDAHAREPIRGEAILRADGTYWAIVEVKTRSELGYLVSGVMAVKTESGQLAEKMHAPTELEIFRGGQDWLAVSDMFEYEGVPFSEAGVPRKWEDYVDENGYA